MAVLPFDDKLVVPAMDRGVPFLTDNRAHPVSRAIIELGMAVKSRIKQIEEAEADML